MRSQTLTHSILYNRIFLLKFPKLNLRIFWILCFILILSLSIFYVFQITQITEKSYLIKTYEKEIESFSQENLDLQINFAHVNSLENIEKKAKELDFEKIKQVKYIQILESSLVTK